jgi:hypothetical protein
MFGDALSLEECRELLQQLSKVTFPFVCAHGRPSIVPVFSFPKTNLSDANSQISSSLCYARAKRAMQKKLALAETEDSEHCIE